MSSNARHASEVAQYLVDFCKQLANPKFEMVEFGDQDLIPRSPALVVFPVNAERTFDGAAYQTLNELRVQMIVYYAKGTKGIDEIQKACDKITEDLIDRVNHDAASPMFGGTNFDGLVRSGLCSNTDYGFAIKRNELMRANRINVNCLSKTFTSPLTQVS